MYFTYILCMKCIHCWKLTTLYKQRLRMFSLDETRLDMLEQQQKNTESHRKVNYILFLPLTVQNPRIFGEIKSNIFTTFGKAFPSRSSEKYSSWIQSNFKMSVIHEIYRSYKMKENC